MFIGIMKIQIWSYLYKKITNPEKNMCMKLIDVDSKATFEDILTLKKD
jgi:hypothetical protein